ncbi:MAG: dienelactone hydrolase family protein [Chloroflexi bacterium]|nr:dienelactone hydrolase family protein [Chloroflexota bacterium]
MPKPKLDLVHCFVPASAPRPANTLLLLHGGDEDEQTPIPLGQSLAPGAALLSPRGPVLEGDKPRFYRRHADRSGDVGDLKAHTHALADFVRAAAATYDLDPARIVVVGFSNGANLAVSLLWLRPETVAAAVLFRPIMPLELERRPDLRGMPVLVAAGTRDRVVAPEEPARLARALAAAGADVVTHWQDAEHPIGPEEISVAREWLLRSRLRRH